MSKTPVTAGHLYLTNCKWELYMGDQDQLSASVFLGRPDSFILYENKIHTAGLCLV